MIVNDLAPVLDLDGPWEFDTGTQPSSTIVVPGCWEAQGYPKMLDGPVRYRRTFTLPADWHDRLVVAEFDSCAALTHANSP
jgi:beta-galactosidase/beta-glucuronidase